MAFFQLEPWGPLVEDDRFRVLTTYVAAPHMPRGSEMPYFFDRDPQPKPAVIDEDELEAFFIARV